MAQVTNAMRILTSKNIKYELFTYDETITDGMLVAKSLGQDPDSVFKTLVTQANTKEYFVFMVPVCAELDLKKAAKVAGVKSIEMIKQKELLPLTGYIHGGCSPVGMKKQFKTFIDEESILYDYIYMSAGKVGHQLKINPEDLTKIIPIEIAEIKKETE